MKEKSIKQLKQEKSQLIKENMEAAIKLSLAYGKYQSVENHKNSLEEIKVDYIEAFKHMRRVELQRLEQSSKAMELFMISCEALIKFYMPKGTTEPSNNFTTINQNEALKNPNKR